LLIALGILLLVYRKRVFRGTTGAGKKLPDSQANIQPDTGIERSFSLNVVLRCKNCSRRFILGQDATVDPSFYRNMFKSTTIVANESSFDSVSKDPDLVYAIQVPWNDLDDSFRLTQKVQINRISSAVAAGEKRSWKCNNCGKVQPYTIIPPYERNFYGASMDEVKQKAYSEIPEQKVIRMQYYDIEKGIVEDPGTITTREVKEVRIIKESDAGSEEVQAYSTEGARLKYGKAQPYHHITDVQCRIKPGFRIYGMFLKKGNYEIKWADTFTVNVPSDSKVLLVTEFEK
jgi:hypothetical protein